MLFAAPVILRPCAECVDNVAGSHAPRTSPLSFPLSWVSTASRIWVWKPRTDSII
jgi:hypothetical protein